jgi:hypothetical protein
MNLQCSVLMGNTSCPCVYLGEGGGDIHTTGSSLNEVITKMKKNSSQPYVREVIIDLGMNEKRASYILEKWTNNGVRSLAGWLTDKGRAVLTHLAASSFTQLR